MRADAAQRGPAAAALLRVDRLSKRFGAVTALDQASFEVHPGEAVALLGVLLDSAEIAIRRRLLL